MKTWPDFFLSQYIKVVMQATVIAYLIIELLHFIMLVRGFVCIVFPEVMYSQTRKLVFSAHFGINLKC